MYFISIYVCFCYLAIAQYTVTNMFHNMRKMMKIKQKRGLPFVFLGNKLFRACPISTEYPLQKLFFKLFRNRQFVVTNLYLVTFYMIDFG